MAAFGWPSRWLRWPDLWLPLDTAVARAAVGELWERAEVERVEVGCHGGLGRTGTVLACLAVLDGVPASDAVGYVRRHYRPRAVETPWQRAYARRFRPSAGVSDAGSGEVR
jgi:protein-tyrosine phosphatase